MADYSEERKLAPAWVRFCWDELFLGSGAALAWLVGGEGGCWSRRDDDEPKGAERDEEKCAAAPAAAAGVEKVP